MLLITSESKCFSIGNWDYRLEFKDESDIEKSIQELDTNKSVSSACIFTEEFNEVKGLVLSRFTVIDAAGGIVSNYQKELLFIFRNGFWDLPKGKREANETILETAVREVKEETGLRDVGLGNFIGNTYHIYFLNNERVLKNTYWFRMYCNQNHLLPQSEEGITEARWIEAANLKMVYEKTYESIKDILGKL